MAEISDADLRSKLEANLASMKNVRSPMEPIWQDEASYFLARKNRYLNKDPRKGDQLNSKLFNTKATRAARIMTNGLYAGASSHARPWFRIQPLDRDLRKNRAAKMWCSAVERAIYDLFASTNFYNVTHGGYRQQGIFGTEATIMRPDNMRGAVCHGLVAGEYWIAVGPRAEPDTLYRNADMTVDQAVRRFGKDKLSRVVGDMYDRGDKQEIVPLIHAIEPNPERIGGMIDQTNMSYRSVYWEPAGDRSDNVLDFSGFEQQPFWAPRWDVDGMAVYGNSPAEEAIGAAKQIQLKELRLQQNQDYGNRPPLKGPPSLLTDIANLMPGGLTCVSPQEDAAFKAIWTVEDRAESYIMDINRAVQGVEETFYVDLFMAISSMEGVQPRNVEELTERVGEKMTQLGPAIERLHNEKLRVSVYQAYGILLRANGLPPAPPELHGQRLEIDFISVLAQMQRATGLTSIERTFAFAGTLSAIDPEIMDNLDSDAAIQGYGDIAGMSPELMRDPEAVKSIRATRQQQVSAATLAASAKPALDLAKAGQTLADTDVGGGQSALERMTGA